MPRSYLDLEELVTTEAQRRQEVGELPIITHEEFLALIHSIPLNDIKTAEDRSLGKLHFCRSSTLHRPPYELELDFTCCVVQGWT